MMPHFQFLEITWTYDDGHGNTSTQTQIVNIDDVTAPLPDLNSLPDVTGECSVSTPSAPTATDNCLNAVVTVTNDGTWPISDQGTTIVTWTFDDGHGNTSTQTQNIVIEDVTSPNPDQTSLPDIIACIQANMPTPPTATDNCSGALTGTTLTSFPITAQGNTVVTWVFEDGNGNSEVQFQNVTVNTVDATTSLSDLTISSNQNGASYVWIDCNNGNQAITGETNQGFMASTNGSYAVVVTINGCSDTSACVDINNVGLQDLENELISIHPNPSSGVFTINSEMNILRLEVIDIQGRLIFKSDNITPNSKDYSVDISNAVNGNYLINVVTSDGLMYTKKLTKQ